MGKPASNFASFDRYRRLARRRGVPAPSAQDALLRGLEADQRIELGGAMADLEARRLLEAHAREFPQGQLAAQREEMLRQLR
ncbi:hypothetical protein [Sorangium sp. So ce1151]|uniref:hypothetical protein n=1 Tax=Sorangium sp. So ce1151 TaxID=3133332 RepID=UPI003F642D1F